MLCIACPGFANAEEADGDPYAQTVILANGNTMVGVVEEEPGGAMWIRVPGGRLRLLREQIVRIEPTSPEVKAQLTAQQQAKRKSQQADASSQSSQPATGKIPTETPLDAFDHPPSWLARIRQAFSDFVDGVIARLAPKPSAPQGANAR